MLLLEFRAGWLPKRLCRPEGARGGPAQRPARNPPEPVPLTLVSPRQRVWPALRAAPGQGQGAGGGGAGLGGSSRASSGGAGTVPKGGDRAEGSPGAWRCPQGAWEGRRGAGRGTRGSLLGPAGRSSLRGRPGSPGRAAAIGLADSPGLTNQSGPAEPRELPPWMRRSVPASPALPADGRLE
ncbi:hypothetical protein NN561_005918 [Cricetulus griseus]